MRASLPMYTLPALASAHDRFWSAIRNHLLEAGLAAPATLTSDGIGLPFWRSADMVFSQTCGLPFRAHLHSTVQLVGTPDYGLPNTPAGHYYSVLIKNRADPRSTLGEFGGATAAFNEAGSQSGFAALAEAADKAGISFAEASATGAHAASVAAVAGGRADLAAIDVVTWTLLNRHSDVAKQTVALAQTRPTPGLPYICAAGFDAKVIRAAVQAAIHALSSEDRAALMLKDLVDIPASSYLAEPVPDVDALSR